jgi:hypothetical protein
MSHKAYVNFESKNGYYKDGTPIIKQKTTCFYCNKNIFDFSPVAYCEPCRKKKIERLKRLIKWKNSQMNRKQSLTG